MALTPGSIVRVLRFPLLRSTPPGAIQFLKSSTEKVAKMPRPRGASAAAEAKAEAVDGVLDMEEDEDEEQTGKKQVSRSEITAVAKAKCEALRMGRALSAVVFLTWLFPVCAVSDALTAAGRRPHHRSGR